MEVRSHNDLSMSTHKEGERRSPSASTDFFIPYAAAPSKECAIDISRIKNEYCCIYKVPENLRNLNEEVYTPQLISIGPLHQDNEILAGMEKHKVNYLRKFCTRTNHKYLKDLIHLWESAPDQRTTRIWAFLMVYFNTNSIRGNYIEISKLCDNEYLKMILLDGIFIIELFLRNLDNKNEKGKKEYDYLIKNQWQKNSIQQDLLLLENQLPYYFLNDIYELAFPMDPDNHKPSFLELTWEYFKKYNLQKLKITDQMRILHFTDLLRYFMFHKPQKVSKSRTKIHFNAVKLHDAGVEFVNTNAGDLSGIKFDKGTLTMPQLEIDYTTERVIRNLIAFEQLHYSFEAYISYYFFLMDCLIDTAKDVELLIEKKIIVNWLGSKEEVAKLVNNFCRNITEYNYCYQVDICEKLNKHYRSIKHRTMATLRGVYFSDVWRGTSTIAAAILLVLTLLQTVNSYLALH